MYVLKHGIKKNPEAFWALPDSIFFGYGACHILAGTFLSHPPLDGFYGERIIPGEDFYGNHIYMTNGVIAFDYHGYSSRERLLQHHGRGWASHSAGWHCTLERVDFDLLDTADLNRRKMRGPDQYLYYPIPRAHRFLQRIDHAEGAARALRTVTRSQPMLRVACTSDPT
ncbi:hypothetical protein [Mesorhizobium sp. LNJC405B00]|uniref:hypothetical protein n=1 Tax=Mesorhizobium sp. LNJC405B00 TaxID=1287281 RepID=UPI0003CE5307|nr:hypothetical protein [Mesorhizobium sp. LNJC405B00]ESX95746.1 hypothetical protein X755_23170 [Mesorhizobium sp. LNJC405B00]